MELPLVGLNKPVKHVPLTFYNEVPILQIARGYPVYHPDKEPKGYMDALRQREPETVTFDVKQLKTDDDWIQAGELVFHAPDSGRGPSVDDVHNRNWYTKDLDVPVAADGTLPGFRYVIRKKGEVSIEGANCARCHTRVLREGTQAGIIVTGAPSNFPIMARFAQDLRAKAADKGVKAGLDMVRQAVPGPHMWWNTEPGMRHDRMTFDEFVSAIEGAPPGVAFRIGTGVVNVPKIPDLVGVKDRKYLDATGLVRHRSLGDLMRYAALVGGKMSGMERHMSYGGRPLGDLPDPMTKLRYTDEQLYALAQYIYALKPPPNPNKLDDWAKRGREVFEGEGCARCHSSKAYGGSTLTPVDGVTVPEKHPAAADIVQKSVGTDADLALNTRKGTGFYRVPSLRGLWYRGLLEHNGSVNSLEDWFDSRRIQANYVPTGWKGPPGTKTRAVMGHKYGLDLSAADRKALIAFLRTL
jgi:cytochrome c553